MKIEEGNYYFTRSGKFRGPVEKRDNPFRPFKCQGLFFDGEGRHKGDAGEDNADLVAPAIVVKMKGSLKQSEILTESEGFMLEMASQYGGIDADDDCNYTLFFNRDLISMMKALGFDKTPEEKLKSIVQWVADLDGHPADIRLSRKHNTTAFVGDPKPTEAAIKEYKTNLAEFMRKLDQSYADALGIPYPSLIASYHPWQRAAQNSLAGQHPTPDSIKKAGERVAAIDSAVLRSVGGKADTHASLMMGLSTFDALRPRSGVENGVPYIVTDTGARLYGAFDKRTGKRFGYDKHERPLGGSIWNADGNPTRHPRYVVVRVLTDKEFAPTSIVEFKKYPADPGVAPFSMELRHWARRMVFVRTAIPASAMMTFGEKLAPHQVPKRVFWDAETSRFIRRSASGKNDYFMSDDFQIAWASETRKFPPYHPPKAPVTMTLDEINPKHLADAMGIKEEPNKVVTGPVRIVFNYPFTTPRDGFDPNRPFRIGAYLNTDSRPVNVWYDAFRKAFYRVDEFAKAHPMDAEFNKKWLPRASEFGRCYIADPSEKLADLAARLHGDIPVREVVKEPIPGGIYFDGSHFRATESRRLMEHGFEGRWWDRRSEFPTTADVKPSIDSVVPKGFTAGEVLRESVHNFGKTGGVVPMPTKTELLLAEIVKYLHQEDRQSEPVRELLKKARELGFRI